MAISAKEFKSRREKVLKHLKDRKAVFYSGAEKIFSNDVHYPFRANSDFYYLTGFKEPDSVLILDPSSPHPATIYLRPKDPEKEIWDGYRTGVEDAKKVIGVDKSCNIEDLPFEKKELCHGNLPEGYTDIKDYIHSLRKIKSEAEIELMRHANQITHQAHRLISDILTPGIYEYEIAAAVNNVYGAKGSDGWAYPPIVASGENSCILHYIENKSKIEDKSVVLVDSGCEYEYYASDITRTYPASGEFTTVQKDIYDIVLAAQKAAIDSVKPGGSFQETHELACTILAEGLKDLGYIKDSMNADELKKYYMHGTGHSLGIDVHDPTGASPDDDLSIEIDGEREHPKIEFVFASKTRTKGRYKPGMVTTIEPGLYIREKGFGIRIEDNVLVTEKGHENLTENLIK